QQQRVALARALVIRPDVLLLDEPLSNLDAKLRIELRSEIRRICKEAGPDGRALTTVYVTHDQKEALSMADRVAIMDRGRVVQVGPPQELYRRPRSRFVAEFLGETNLVRATAGQRTPSGLELATLAGPLLAASDGPPAPGSPLLCSIRPEAVSLQPRPGASSLAGRVVESVYLGEIIQHTVELRGGQRLLAVELNPGATAWSRGGTDVTVSVFPQDVVILAEP
ncbi:MAG TPA: ABC transporter ATP-binding protein, partial [Phycisphaerales bacterium]|nr:ABC transporter ATP-binding protein [Phycisphaerales bacterium]